LGGDGAVKRRGGGPLFPLAFAKARLIMNLRLVLLCCTLFEPLHEFLLPNRDAE
jgi:hypothetical protein